MRPPLPEGCSDTIKIRLSFPHGGISDVSLFRKEGRGRFE